MNKAAIASLIGLLFSSCAVAEEINIQTDDVIVSATRFEHKDTETTYASELYTREMIEASGATTLYDYLSQHTSVNILPSFGNKATPLIDMRGYGTSNGNQNIVITLDGQRLNNIDLSPQLIGAIPLGTIDRIEITKGSGSVLFGDGATAGSIQIYTKPKTGVSVSASAGNFGQLSGFLNAGTSQEYFDLSVSAAHDSNDGFSKKDITGEKDGSDNNAQHVQLKLKPLENLRFNLEGTSTRIDSRYVGALTLAEFKADPRQNGGNEYNHQKLKADVWRIGSEFDITPKLKISANHARENKTSDFISPFPSLADYDYTFNDLALQYQGEAFNILVGLQKFDGSRSDAGSAFTPANETSKDTTGYFAQTEYRFDAFTLSAGARHDKVKYKYATPGTDSLKDSEELEAWDIGLNYRINTEASVFANYNRAFQSPDIDRFFTSVFGGPSVFNGFIKPEKTKTLTVGLNHVMANNRFKLTAFYTDLHDEIYFFADPVNFVFINTNIDRSHKYGLELQDYWRISDKLNGSLIYTFTRAIIDKEDRGDGAFNGKDLPGVPEHGITASLNYNPWENTNLSLSHTWRSSAFAINDFANDFAQRQISYNSTDISLSYQYKNMNWFTSINNIFEHKNALFVQDNAIYPVDFFRTWRVGMRADF